MPSPTATPWYDFIKDDGTAGEPVALPSGYGLLDGIELDGKGNIYISEIFLNQIWAPFA